MINRTRLSLAFSLFIAIFLSYTCPAKGNTLNFYNNAAVFKYNTLSIDSLPPAEVMQVIEAVVHSTNSFNVDAVTNLYTPNAVIADDDPPYSWNGPTAGIQWVNAVEKVCKENGLTKLKGTIETIKVYQQSADNVYIVVPVNYTGNLPGKQRFAAKGVFTFVLRLINGKWMIKSQVWMPEKAIEG